MSSRNKAWLIALTVLVGFYAAVVSHYIAGYYHGLPYPRNTFLCMPGDMGNDLFHILRATKTGAPYTYQWSVYFPFTYVAVFPLALLPPRTAYVFFASIFLATVIWIVVSALKSLRGFEKI